MKEYIKNTESYQKLLKAPYQLIAIMTLIVIFITTVSIYGLYKVGFEQQKKRLIEIVQSQAIMIDMIVQHQIKHNSIDVIEKIVLKELTYAHEKFSGFGETGEYVLAKLDTDNIHFLLRHRHNGVDRMNSISITSTYAEPMRRALRGKSGVVIGLDYRGSTVLAAYEPIKNIAWGIVAKIDITEIQAPYISAAIYGVIGAFFLIMISAVMVIRFIKPLTHEIEHSREYNRMLFNESPIGLALADMGGNLIDVNPIFADLIGYSIEESLTLSYWDITPNRYKYQEEEQLTKLWESGHYGPYEKEYIHKDGHLLNVRLSGSLIKKDGQYYIWSSAEDVTEHKRNEMALKEAALVFEHTHEGIMITDEKAKIIRINSTFTEITGFTLEDVYGKNPSILQSGNHDKEFYKDVWETLNNNGTWCGEFKNRRKTGEYFATFQSITAVKNEDGTVSGYVSVFSDISERKNNEIQLAYLATHDSLTSLPNRMYFHDNLHKSIQVAKRNRYKIAVLFLDLNHFKDVNDTFGHEVGDHLLKEVADRLKSCVREEDTIARLGGDEFAVILPELKIAEDALIIAQKIIEKVGEPLRIGNINLTPSTSIGISIYPEHGSDSDTLLKLADKAMYVAKKRADIKYELYDLEID